MTRERYPTTTRIPMFTITVPRDQLERCVCRDRSVNVITNSTSAGPTVPPVCAYCLGSGWVAK